MDGGVEHLYIPKSACVMASVWYCIDYDYHFCAWTKDGVDWKGVKGLGSLIVICYRNCGSNRNIKLVSCGGKLLLLCEGYRRRNTSNMKKILCAEIKLETDNEGQVWGNVEWIDIVQSVPTHFQLLHWLFVSV